jgi:hypothetical protein
MQASSPLRKEEERMRSKEEDEEKKKRILREKLTLVTGVDHLW